MLAGPKFGSHHLGKFAVESCWLQTWWQGRTFSCTHIHHDPIPGFGLGNVHREKWNVESLGQGDERGPIDRIFGLPMVMRSDQQPPFPEEEAIFFAQGILPRTFPTRAQRHILLHDKAPEERLPLLVSEVLGDSLKVFS